MTSPSLPPLLEPRLPDGRFDLDAVRYAARAAVIEVLAQEPGIALPNNELAYRCRLRGIGSAIHNRAVKTLRRAGAIELVRVRLRLSVVKCWRLR